jgi:hypothetical protein
MISLTGTLEIADGVTEMRMSIDLVDDSAYEKDEVGYS